jgi:hypothetical protein
MQPNGSMGYYEDGANILDSNSGTQLSNINSDMVTGVQVMTNSFGADFPQGPTVFQTDSKSGGRTFHGEAYEYARNSDMYSEDAFMKADGLAKPYAFFYYTGGNIGGPLWTCALETSAPPRWQRCRAALRMETTRFQTLRAIVARSYARRRHLCPISRYPPRLLRY